MEELAEPRATRLVHEATNNGIRDDNDTLDLPAWTTKRELYRCWCHNQGWIMRSTDMGNWKRIPREDFFEEGEPSEDDIVSWGTFLNFWSKNYSHLIIRCPNADICPDCYIAANILKFGSRKNNTGDDNDDDDVDLPELEPGGPSNDDDDYVLGMGIFSLEEREDQVILAGEHVKLAKCIRELFRCAEVPPL